MNHENIRDNKIMPTIEKYTGFKFWSHIFGGSLKEYLSIALAGRARFPPGAAGYRTTSVAGPILFISPCFWPRGHWADNSTVKMIQVAYKWYLHNESQDAERNLKNTHFIYSGLTKNQQKGQSNLEQVEGGKCIQKTLNKNQNSHTDVPSGS